MIEDFTTGRRVRVVQVIDDTTTPDHVGREGSITHTDYLCGCGQSTPGDPMIGVMFDDGKLEEFWREELEALGEEKNQS